jgi:hypothetical protein
VSLRADKVTKRVRGEETKEGIQWRDCGKSNFFKDHTCLTNATHLIQPLDVSVFNIQNLQYPSMSLAFEPEAAAANFSSVDQTMDPSSQWWWWQGKGSNWSLDSNNVSDRLFSLPPTKGLWKEEGKDIHGNNQMLTWNQLNDLAI